jgi:type IV pilus assembly protein PilC
MEFEYVGYNVDRRVTKGKITAASEKAAGDNLSRDGYQVLSLKSTGLTNINFNMPTFFEKGAKEEEIILFSRQLALLLESGVGIVQSLELLRAQTTNKALAKILDTIVADLRAGSPFSASLEKHPKAFNKMYCKIIAVGEQTGQLEGVLRNMASYAEQSTTTARKIKQAMTYPITVLLLAVVVGFIMVSFVLPPIMEMFKQLGGQLPLITRMLIAVVTFMGNYGVYVMIAVIIAGFFLYSYSKTPAGTLQKDWIALKLPVLGRLNHINALSRVCRSITLLFRSGLPLPNILRLAAESSGNQVLHNALMEAEQEIIKGVALAEAMRRQSVFLPLMVEMTKVGEETGNLDNTLNIVADSYEIEAADKLQTVLGMIEPIMTIFIGVVVGGLALSIFVPIYSSLSLVGGK